MILLMNMNLLRNNIPNQIASSSPDYIGWLIGGLGILIGAIISIIIYNLSRIGPRLSHQMRAETLIGGPQATLPEAVSILFNNEVVPRVTRTIIYLWNSGRATVDGKQMVTEDPLRLEYKDGTKILQASILKRTRVVNKMKVDIDPDADNKVLCIFDYLDTGDGVRIEVLHTGEDKYPSINGTIRGMPRGIIDCGLDINSDPNETRIFGISFRIFRYFYVMIFSGAMIVAGIVYPFIPSSVLGQSQSFRWILLGGGCLLFIPMGLMIWDLRRRFPKILS